MREHTQGGGDLSTFQLNAVEMQAQSGSMSDREFKLKFLCDPQIKEAMFDQRSSQLTKVCRS